MINNPAKFFDDILKFLSSNYNKTVTFKEIHQHLFPDDFNYTDDDPLEELHFDNSNENIIRDALNFLYKEGLVAVNLESDLYLINTAGFVKIKTQGFEGEIREKRLNIILQRFTWIVLPLAAIITTIVVVIDAFC